MKIVTTLTALFFVCMCSAALAAVSTVDHQNLQNVIVEKDAAVTVGIPDPELMVGGEDISSAAPIPGLPYSDGGSTAGYVNDYDEVCPFSGSTSPDVVYAYTPGAAGAIDIDLCNSGYDTKVYVYENAVGALVGCNDDACGSDGFRSELVGVPVSAGNTYYIVVDGYGGASGVYEMNVTENVPCIVDCPPDGVAEGEPDCYEGYNDNYNGGCNSSPNVWTMIPCDADGAVTVCGTYGGFFHPQSGFNYRDTDWYELDLDANDSGITWCVTGEYETLSGYINGDLGCGAPSFVEAYIHDPCVTQCYSVPAGNYWLFVATSGFGPLDFPCPADYVMTLDGYACPPVSVEPANWSKIKANYR